MDNKNIDWLFVAFKILNTIIACVSVLAIIFIFVVIWFPTDHFPAEGEWYCEELEMQLAFDAESECFMIIDGQKIQCECFINRGSNWLSVNCMEKNSEYYHLGKELFRYIRNYFTSGN